MRTSRNNDAVYQLLRRNKPIVAPAVQPTLAAEEATEPTQQILDIPITTPTAEIEDEEEIVETIPIYSEQ